MGAASPPQLPPLPSPHVHHQDPDQVLRLVDELALRVGPLRGGAPAHVLLLLSAARRIEALLLRFLRAQTPLLALRLLQALPNRNSMLAHCFLLRMGGAPDAVSYPRSSMGTRGCPTLAPRGGCSTKCPPAGCRPPPSRARSSPRGSSAPATSMDDMFSGKFCAPDVVAFTTLISRYLGAGDHAEALDVLHSLMPRRRCSPTVVSYNCVLNELFGIGQVDTAMLVLEEMSANKVGADPVTHTVVIKGLCGAGAGLVEKAKEFWDSTVVWPSGIHDDYVHSAIFRGLC